MPPFSKIERWELSVMLNALSERSSTLLFAERGHRSYLALLGLA